MATKQQVIDLHRQNPTWTSRQIAEAIGCCSAYVRATAERNNLTLGRTIFARTNQVKRASKIKARANKYRNHAAALLAKAATLEALANDLGGVQ